MIVGGVPLLLKTGGKFPDVSLLAGYTFEDQTGTTLTDVSGNGHTGTLTDTGLWTASGKVDGGEECDGTNYITAGTGNELGFTASDPFGYAVWIFVPTGETANTGINHGSHAHQTSGTVAGSNRGFVVRNLDLTSRGFVNITVHVRCGSNTVSGDFFRGYWSTGLVMAEGWNLLVVNRRTNGADVWLRNATDGETSASTTDGLNNHTFSTADFVIDGLQLPGVATTPTISGVKFDCQYWIQAEWSAADREALWNNGNGIQP